MHQLAVEYVIRTNKIFYLKGARYATYHTAVCQFKIIEFVK